LPSMLGKVSNDISIAFGLILRRRRRALRLSQEQLGLEAEVNRNYISLIELGRSQPTIGMVFKLAGVLGVSSSELVSEVEDILRRSSKQAP
jgi:transcriptional regulator with XRE-family HTH domain